MKENNLKKITKPSLWDAGHAVITGILPPVAAQFFGLIVAPPISKRRDEFLAGLYEDIMKLKKQIKSFDEKKLENNELFQTMVFNAARIAISTHQKEKIEALKNAVLNSIIEPEINESVQLLFLNYIDRLLPIHLMLLDFFKKPYDYCLNKKVDMRLLSNASIWTLLNKAIPGIERSLLMQIINDLYNYGFITVSGSNIEAAIEPFFRAIYNECTTPLGNSFIKFITSPIKES